MTIVNLICPSCRKKEPHEERNIDTSKEIACSACGFSGLPTAFELGGKEESESWRATKIAIIILLGIGLAFFGLSFIVLAAFYVPIIIAIVIPILLYRRWKEKKAGLT